MSIKPLSKLLFLLALVVSFGSCDDESIPATPSLSLLSQTAIPGTLTMDVWGYFDVATNKEYALVGDFSDLQIGSLSIVDVTNPVAPIIVSTIDDIVGFDMKVWQNYVYVSDGGFFSSNFERIGHIVDISDPANPQKVGTFESSHNIWIDNGYLYLAGGGKGVRIFDLNNTPAAPELVWEDDLGTSNHDIAVIRGRLYDFHSSDGTLIYDITDPANPGLLGTVPYTGFNHSGWVTDDNNTLFICDEGASDPLPDITVWDISDPAQASQIATISDSEARTHNIYIEENYALVSYYGSGFKVFDISDPSQPELATEFDTNINQDDGIGGGFEGAFGVYPFTNSTNIYVTDMGNGLFIFKLNK